jgi:hypothetical protein
MAIILTPEEIAQYRSAWANTKVGVRNFSQSSKSEVEGKKSKFLRQDWAGALKDLREEYTSLELQKKILEWWDEDLCI